MVAIALFSGIFLATAAFAFPTSIESRSARRPSGASQRTEASSLTPTNATSDASYSRNWAGASFETYPNGTFTSVTGTFKVPKPRAPEGSAAVWVGIDGDNQCPQAILQTGIVVNFTNGDVSYSAWYEWYPEYPVFFNGFSINAGDEIRLTVTATSSNGGTSKIENLTTKKEVKHVFQSEHVALCRRNAEWIVEDYSQHLCNFGVVEFTNAYATTTANHRLTPDAADIVIMRKNGKDILSAIEKSHDGVTIKY